MYIIISSKSVIFHLEYHLLPKWTARNLNSIINGYILVCQNTSVWPTKIEISSF